MKKNLLILLALALLLTGCGKTANKDTKQETSGQTSGEEMTIGIVQFMEHPALDETRQGFEDVIKESGLNIKIDYKSAQGTIDNSRLLAENFVDQKVDMIFAIATPAAQAVQAVTSEIPILFSAVTDPVSAGLVDSNENPGGNVTGTSDMVDIKDQLSMFKEIDPSIETIGIVFSADEENSVQQVKLVEGLVGELGLKLETISIQNLSDLPQATEAITEKIDGMYVLTDNKVVSSVSLVADILKDKGLVSVAAEDSSTRNGILVSRGISYYDLGRQTGEMALKVLKDGVKPADIAVEQSKTPKIVVNKATLEALGLDASLKVFEGAELVE